MAIMWSLVNVSHDRPKMAILHCHLVWWITSVIGPQSTVFNISAIWRAQHYDIPWVSANSGFWTVVVITNGTRFAFNNMKGALLKAWSYEMYEAQVHCPLHRARVCWETEKLFQKLAVTVPRAAKGQKTSLRVISRGKLVFRRVIWQWSLKRSRQKRAFDELQCHHFCRHFCQCRHWNCFWRPLKKFEGKKTGESIILRFSAGEFKKWWPLFATFRHKNSIHIVTKLLYHTKHSMKHFHMKNQVILNSNCRLDFRIRFTTPPHTLIFLSTSISLFLKSQIAARTNEDNTLGQILGRDT